MHKFKLSAVAACTAIILTGCGGGGGGSSSGGNANNGGGTITPTPPGNNAVYQGSNARAAITAESTDSFSDTVNGDIFAVLDNVTEGSSTVNSNGNLTGGCGGSANLDNDLGSSGTGSLGMTFNDFDSCSGVVVNGTLTFSISQFDMGRDEIIAAGVDFDRLTFVGNGINFLMDGIFSMNVDRNNRVETTTTNLFEVADNISNTQFKLENYTESTKYSSSSLSTVVGLHFAGRVFASGEGFVDLQTTTDFICTQSSSSQCGDFDPDRSGQIVLSGDGNGRAMLSFLEHNQNAYEQVLRQEVDANGDGVIEATRLEAVGTNGSGNKPAFAYAGRNVEVTFADVQQVVLDASPSFDAEGDNLSYQWTAIDVNDSRCQLASPQPGGDLDVVLSDVTSAQLTIDATAQGDHCFSVTVGDGNRNADQEAVDVVGVSFKAPPMTLANGIVAARSKPVESIHGEGDTVAPQNTTKTLSKLLNWVK